MVHRTLENLENLEISWDEKDDLDNLENLEITWDFLEKSEISRLGVKNATFRC